METKEKRLCAHVLDEGKFVEKYLTELSKSIGEEGVNNGYKITEALEEVFSEKLGELGAILVVLETVQELNKQLFGKKILVKQENGWVDYLEIENVYYNFVEDKYYIHHKIIRWNYKTEDAITLFSKHYVSPIEAIFDWNTHKLNYNCEETEEDLWEIKIFLTKNLFKNKKETSDNSSEEDYVDLGLPSGLLWAKKNIGAATEEDAGLYFQWEDIQGYTTEQVGVDKQFSWNDYKWGTSSNFTKYNSSDGLVTLEAADDAATQIMGSDWRMPTREEFIELVDNTDVYCISTDGSEIQATPSGSGNFEFPVQDTMKGLKFYRKNDHSKYIFVPASGEALDGSIRGVGVGGYLISSSLDEADASYAWRLYFNASVFYNGVYSGLRHIGFGARGVANA